MQLMRVSPSDPNLGGKLKVAIDLANTLEDFPTWDRIREVIKQIPDSNNYFVYVVDTKTGYQIHILEPQ